MSEHPYSDSGNVSGNSGNNPNKNPRSVGGIVHSVLQDGDLSRLKDIGPAIQNSLNLQTRPTGNVPAKRGQTSPWVNSAGRAMWAGSNTMGKIKIPKGFFLILFGSIGILTFSILAIVFGALATAGILEFAFGTVALASLAFDVLFIGMLGRGLGKRKLGKLAESYYKLFEKKKVYTFDELSAHFGKAPKQIKKELRKIRARGLLKDVYTDADETCIMHGADTYQQYLDAEKMRLEKDAEEQEHQRRLSDPATSDLERFRAERESVLGKIRKANDEMPGEEISNKLFRLEATTSRIFSYVEQHPEKLPETRKFLAYYLPTTLKLVEKYQQFEAMDYKPENVMAAKSDIEHALDTIDVAFKNLLESLYAHDTLDVATDIEVLKNMLDQEGLMGKKFDIEPSSQL